MATRASYSSGLASTGGPTSSSASGSEDMLTPEAAVRICQDVQHMIDINSEHLERLRTPMTTSSEITKQEIRTLEGKLIKHFSQQLATKAALNSQKNCDASVIGHYPNLQQWLKVVGITKESADILENRVRSLDSLKEKTDSELNRVLLQAPRLTSSQRQEDLRRMSRALQNLRKYTDSLIHGNSRGGGYSTGDANQLELYWDSWDTTSSNIRHPPSRGYHDPKHHRSNHIVSQRCHTTARDDSASPKQDGTRSSDSSDWVPPPSTPPTKAIPKVDSASSSLSSCGSLPPQSPGLTLSPPVITNYHDNSMINRGSNKLVTPPTTPPWAALKGSSNGNSKFPTTPPPVRKHSTGIQKSDCVLIKSKSHESELTNRINPGGGGASTNAVVKDIPISPTTTTPTATVSTSAVTAPTAATETPIKPALNCGNPGLMSTVSSSSYTISTNSSTAMRSSVSDMPICSTSDVDNNLSNMSHVPVFRQKRLQTEPTLDTTVAIASGYDGHSPVASPRSPPNLFDANEMMMGHSSTLQVPPKSPRTPRSMGHLIKHRFTKTFKPGKCDHCSEYMFNGLKCKECKFRCHRDCESQVPPSCGLPEDLLRHYISQITKEGSPIMPMRLPAGMGASADPAILARFAPGFASSSGVGASQGGAALNPSMHYLDSSSNTSSCNSSTPSSPAVVLVTSHPTPPHSASMYQNAKTKFMFPDTPAVMKMASESSQNQQQSTMNKPSSPNPIIDSVKSYDSDKTLSLSGIEKSKPLFYLVM